MTERRVATAVLDASALLALLHSEPGGEIVEEAVEQAAISTVNWARGLPALAGARSRRYRPAEPTWKRSGSQIVPFTVDDAEQAAELWSLTRQRGLSLGDRACLGLARRLGLPALTADRAWLDVDLGVEVRAIR